MTLYFYGTNEYVPTRAQLRGSAYESPTRGVYRPTGEVALHEHCAAIQLALPADAVFTHLTAAALRGWPLPEIATLPIIASTDSEAPHHDRRGVYVRRCAVPPEDRHSVDGVRVASPEWTIVELAEDLALLDLVCVIDAALHRGDTTVERLRSRVVPRRRGARTLRRALRLVDARSESWWESVLRLAHVLCGIEVESQVELCDRDGAFVARLDLRIKGTARGVEYDGADHRDRDRHRDDLAREKRLARVSVERYGYTKAEIVQAPQMVVRDAEDALGLPHDSSRGKFWLDELQQGSITPTGFARLARRLRRFDRRVSPRSC